MTRSIVSFLALTFAAAQAHATVTAGINGAASCQVFPDLSAAVSAAGAGGTVAVRDNLTGEALGDLSFDVTFVPGSLVDCSEDLSRRIVINGLGGGQLANVTGGATVTFNRFDLVNHTHIRGGTLSATDSTLVLIHSSIQGSSATWGGGVWLSAGTLSLKAGSRIGSSTAVYGGGVFAEQVSGVEVLTGSRINNNVATGSGGGIYLETRSAAHVDPSGRIGALNQGNTANIGAGIFADDATLTLEGSIEGNVATTSGGGIYAAASQLDSFGGRIDDNSAGYRGGGVLTTFESELLLLDTKVRNNSAPFGGGMELSYSYAVIDSSWDPDHCDLSAVANNAEYCSEISGNGQPWVNGGFGGAIRAVHAALELRHTAVLDNHAKSGSAIEAYSSIVISNAVLYADNVFAADPGYTGAVVVATESNLFHVNDTITGNVGYPIEIGPGTTGTISQTIVWGQIDPNGFPVGVRVVEPIVFPTGCSDIDLVTGAGSLDPAGYITTDPLFVDEAGGDYRLGVGSPARDQCPQGANDIDLLGVLRVDGANDIGAYE